jgi:ubiquinol-cytochrome c reductase subunit 8
LSPLAPHPALEPQLSLTAVSPFAQKPFKGAINGYVFWGFRRIAQQVPYFIVPFGVGYAVYVWGKDK